MALSKIQKQKIEEEEAYRMQVIAGAIPKQTHGLPALLSFFIPGLGQIVKGEVGTGILFFIGFFIGLACFILPGIIVWIWQIADAYSPKEK